MKMKAKGRGRDAVDAGADGGHERGKRKELNRLNGN